MQGIPQIAQGQPVSPPVTAQIPVALTPGEVVRGEVINILPDAVSMRIKKEIVLSKTDIPLRKGEVYLLRVESVDEQNVTLKVLQTLTGETDEAKKILQGALNNLEEVSSDQMASARAVLKGIPDEVQNQLPAWGALARLLTDAGEITDGLLKAAVHSTGILFETKLKEWVLRQMDEASLPGEGEGGEEIARIIREDLKGNLLKLKTILRDPNWASRFMEKGNVETIETAVDKLLAHIERQQIESKMNGVLQTFLPFVWKGLQDGKMLFKESYHLQEGIPEYGCVIHLDFTHAGKVVAMVRLVSERLHLRFVTESVVLKDLIEANAPLLKKQLADAGMVCDVVRVEQEENIDFGRLTEEPELDIQI